MHDLDYPILAGAENTNIHLLPKDLELGLLLVGRQMVDGVL
jgi:hypothetical protein